MPRTAQFEKSAEAMLSAYNFVRLGYAEHNVEKDNRMKGVMLVEKPGHVYNEHRRTSSKQISALSNKVWIVVF
jgi:hypothetical protein